MYQLSEAQRQELERIAEMALENAFLPFVQRIAEAAHADGCRETVERAAQVQKAMERYAKTSCDPANGNAQVQAIGRVVGEFADRLRAALAPDDRQVKPSVPTPEEAPSESRLIPRLHDLVTEMRKHSNDHLHDKDPTHYQCAAIEGVCADRIEAILGKEPEPVIHPAPKPPDTAADTEREQTVRDVHDSAEMELLASSTLETLRETFSVDAAACIFGKRMFRKGWQYAVENTLAALRQATAKGTEAR